MESEIVQKKIIIEKPEEKTFDILEQAVSTIEPDPNEDSNIDNRVPQVLYPSTRIPEKAKTIPKYFIKPRYPVNTGNILCPACNLRFESVNVKDVHYELVHKEKNSHIEIGPGGRGRGRENGKCPVSIL